ncbi:MAG: GNAT family N-acetyltransferase [Cyanosarcina radialis HA8281-LM2]|jgi:hypothetical protein|nr:GNAT family N-acetyltransferase [Cyanosarcina radialis HA8281-LM2]
MTYTPPTPLQPEHNLELFDCGEPTLNRWLKERARDSEGAGAARTYIVCWDSQVVGYYCLATGSTIRSQAPGKIKRNMPDPIPVMVLGRLGVDINHQSQGIGMGLVKDAVIRTWQASEIVGVRAILVRALNGKVKQFYEEKCGFVSSPSHPLKLMVTLADVKNSLKF